MLRNCEKKNLEVDREEIRFDQNRKTSVHRIVIIQPVQLWAEKTVNLKYRAVQR
jgi:hypothetical protein